MSYLNELRIGELDATDAQWLCKAAATGYTGMQARHIMEEARDGMARIFRVGEHKGILVLKVLQHPALRELYIVALAGEDIIQLMEEAFPELEALARELGCKRIGAMVERASMERVLTRKLNFKPELAYCAAEVKDE